MKLTEQEEKKITNFYNLLRIKYEGYFIYKAEAKKWAEMKNIFNRFKTYEKAMEQVGYIPGGPAFAHIFLSNNDFLKEVNAILPKPKKKKKVKKTERGFGIIEFKDKYGIECSLQKSSLATENCIWLGVNDPKPEVLLNDAIKGGFNDMVVEKKGADLANNPWCKFIIPESVHLKTRMHLNQKQVKEILPHLIKFAETGDL